MLSKIHHQLPEIAERPIPVNASLLSVLMAEASVQAGFPSPAEDCAVSRLDISKILVQHEQATFLLRVGGFSMKKYGIDDRDLLLVDRAIRARHGMIVVAEIDGEHTVKKLYDAGGVVKLQAGNPTYPDIYPKDGQSLILFGVVTWCFKKFGS
ncbi:LexA family transcriptional regulator [Comamonas testosteroni]|jgi:DNA polymerase V|uniref:LexA family protein n=1 Tax=Comamonas testosteroni TaxID=285 RepID=UPI0026EB62BE|nr:translesion error-prone DNA polymerase V autoproteolytic subunit [Comamonas testosteroni]